MKTLATLLKTSRLYYVILAVAPAIAGYLTYYQNNFSLLRLFVVGAVFGFLGMASWSTNDIFDKEFDKKGRSKTFYGFYIAGGIDSQKIPIWIVTIYILILIFIALTLALTINIAFFILAFVSGLVGIFYSIPPIRLKTRGILGATIISLSYGLISFIAGSIGADGQISYESLIFGVIMSVFVFGYDGIGHIIDYSDDKANGLQTFVVKLGLPSAIRLLAICQISPIIILCCLGLTGILNFNLSVGSVLLTITVITTLILFRRNEHHLFALRLISVPLLSTSFFLILH